MGYLAVFISLFLFLNTNVFCQVTPKVEQGKLVKIDTPSGQIDCPVSPVKNIKTIPGVTNDEKTFTRDQDSVGWCADFPLSDMICHSIQQKLNRAIQKCSALDLELSLFDYKSNRFDPKNTQEFYDGTKNRFTEKVAFVNANGICPESVLPSEFRNNGMDSGERSKLREALKKFSEAVSKNNMTEASAALKGFCTDCGEKFQDETNLGKLKNDLEKILDREKPVDIALLKEISVKTCEGKRLGKGLDLKLIEQDLSRDNTGLSKTDRAEKIKEVHRVIANGQPVMTSLEGNWFLKKGTKLDHHFALIVGSMIKDNKCYYIVKNSWGKDCSPYNENEHLICSKSNGLLAIDSRMLSESNFRWLE
jgi:hypothetical protein